MVCIYCSNNTRVVNSRPQQRSKTIWRRRQCLKCSAVFTTIESADLSNSWTVRYPSGAISTFQADKLLLSIYESLRHRPSAISDARQISATIISKLYSINKHGVIKSQELKDTVLVSLSRFDKVAGVQYQAFHAS